MEKRTIKTKLISVLLAAAILLVNFNFLPVQSIINQSISTGMVVAYAATTKPGKWIKESNGKWWYKHTDGTYTKNDWEYINGYWYHFDANGWMQTGWLKVDGKWYHLNSEGKMHIGWVKIGNYWYHFDSNGVRQTGWQKLNGEWYYFNSDGIRQVGWQQVDGKWYHLDSNGIMETGWVKIGTDWYYFNSNGIRQTGWITLNNKVYYLDSDGIMQIGWKTLNSRKYFFNSDGSMQTGWKKISGDWYCFTSEGIMRVNPFFENQRRYEFNDSGKLIITDILITRQQQEMSNWCWAACSVMVGKYNTKSTITQSDVVEEIKEELINRGGSLDETVAAVNYASNYTKSSRAITNTLSFNDIVSKIDDNKPLIIGLIWENGGRHMVVCAGYRKTKNYVRIIDPWEDVDIKYYSYEDLINGADFGEHTGTYVETVAY